MGVLSAGVLSVGGFVQGSFLRRWVHLGIRHPSWLLRKPAEDLRLQWIGLTAHQRDVRKADVAAVNPYLREI